MDVTTGAFEVVVLGCGAVGLPLALALAQRGYRVVGVDKDRARLAKLMNAESEPDPEQLSERLRELGADRLQFTSLIPASDSPRVFVATVATPVDDTGGFDACQLHAAVGAAVDAARDSDLIVIRSTVPIGTTRQLAQTFDKGQRLGWAACPDRSFAGRALADQFEIPHIIGGLCETSAAMAGQMFRSLAPDIQVSSPETAEALKLFANVHRDMHFALANQFAVICEATGVKLSEVRRAGRQGVGFSLPRAGPVGGPCLQKDTYLLANPVNGARDLSPMLLLGRRLNADLPDRVAEAICEELSRLKQPGPVAILGLAFKASPPVRTQAGSFGLALRGVLRTLSPDLDIRTWDPVCDAPSGKVAALRGAAVVVLANEHPELADLSLLAELCPNATVHDMCGVTLGRDAPANLRIHVFGDGAPR